MRRVWRLKAIVFGLGKVFHTIKNLNAPFSLIEIFLHPGYDELRECKILSEELFYNEEYKSYTVLLLDIPLIGPYNPPQGALEHLDDYGNIER